MKKRELNYYRIVSQGKPFAAKIRSFDEAYSTVQVLLASRGHDLDAVELEIYRDLPDHQRFPMHLEKFWLRPNNRFKLWIEAYKSNVVEDGEIFETEVNKIFEHERRYNGSALKQNSIEESSKYKQGLRYTREIEFARSAERFKGLTTLKRKAYKEVITDLRTAEKIERLHDGASLSSPNTADKIIRRLKDHGVDIPLIRQYMRPRYKGSRKELNRLIESIS